MLPIIAYCFHFISVLPLVIAKNDGVNPCQFPVAWITELISQIKFVSNIVHTFFGKLRDSNADYNTSTYF